jgi:hypothetical protein
MRLNNIGPFRLVDTHSRQLPYHSIPGKRRAELSVQFTGYFRAALLIGKFPETNHGQFRPRAVNSPRKIIHEISLVLVNKSRISVSNFSV